VIWHTNDQKPNGKNGTALRKWDFALVKKALIFLRLVTSPKGPLKVL